MNKHKTPENFSDEQQKNEINTEELQQAKIKRAKMLSTLILIIALAGSCVGLFVKFSFDKAYVEEQMAAMAQSNEEAFKDIDSRLAAIEEDMSTITPALEEAGTTFDSTSSETRESMNNKIQDLDKQLKELKKAIELLKESDGNY